MADRLVGKMAVVVGAGQTPGETIGNGRATAMTLAREGALVAVADRRLESAQDTASMDRTWNGIGAWLAWLASKVVSEVKVARPRGMPARKSMLSE